MAEIFNFSTFSRKKRVIEKFNKDKMTGRVDILWCILEKIKNKQN